MMTLIATVILVAFAIPISRLCFGSIFWQPCSLGWKLQDAWAALAAIRHPPSRPTTPKKCQAAGAPPAGNHEDGPSLRIEEPGSNPAPDSFPQGDSSTIHPGSSQPQVEKIVQGNESTGDPGASSLAGQNASGQHPAGSGGNGAIHHGQIPAQIQSTLAAADPASPDTSPKLPPATPSSPLPTLPLEDLKTMASQIALARQSLDEIAATMDEVLGHTWQRQAIPYLESIQAQLDRLEQFCAGGKEIHESFTVLKSTLRDYMGVIGLLPIQPQPGTPFSPLEHRILVPPATPIPPSQALVQELIRPGWRSRTDDAVLRPAEITIQSGLAG